MLKIPLSDSVAAGGIVFHKHTLIFFPVLPDSVLNILKLLSQNPEAKINLLSAEVMKLEWLDLILSSKLSPSVRRCKPVFKTATKNISLYYNKRQSLTLCTVYFILMLLISYIHRFSFTYIYW